MFNSLKNSREVRLYEGGSAFVYLLLAGAIAQALAARDQDIEAAKVAYEEQRYEPAATHLAQAKERRGDRPEIAFNLGLLAMAQDDDASAKKLFERASESPEDDLRASARFELGNLAFDAKDWDSAIANFIDCLKERPLHEDAKWNLELALAEKQKEEKEKEKNKDQDKENKDEENKDEDNKDEENKDEDNKDEDNKDEENNEDQEGSSSSGGSDGSESQTQDGATSSTGGEDESSSDEGQGGDSSQQDDQSSTSSQPQESSAENEQEPNQDKQPPPAAPAKSNLDRALEDLDREDPFMFGMPRGRRHRVKEDW